MLARAKSCQPDYFSTIALVRAWILILLPAQVRVREVPEGLRVAAQPAGALGRRPRGGEAARVSPVRKAVPQGRFIPSYIRGLL